MDKTRMKWFKHDSNAHRDAKLKRLKHKHGIVGYGIYWYCIELIAESVDRNHITFELEEDAELIALEWGLDQIKVQEIMRDMVGLDLFSNESGQITCLKLAKRLDDTNAKNPEIKNILLKLNGNNLINSEILGDTPNVSGQIRLDQNRLDHKNKRSDTKKRKMFVKPTIQECFDYCLNKEESERFWHFYESKNWMVGKNKMVIWKSALTNWIKNASKKQSSYEQLEQANNYELEKIRNIESGQVRDNVLEAMDTFANTLPAK